MSCVNNQSNINETFIIEPMFVGTDVVSACTALYTNELISCSGNTQILMGTNTITFNGNLYTSNNLTAHTINGSTYFSGGTNLLDIFSRNDIHLTGGTFNTDTDTLTLVNSNGSVINVTGFTDYYTTGMTYSNNELSIFRNDGTTFSVMINDFTGLTVNGDFSATTLYGDGSNLTNVDNIYNIDGSLSSNRAVNLNGQSLTFTGGTMIPVINSSGQLLLGNGNYTGIQPSRRLRVNDGTASFTRTVIRTTDTGTNSYIVSEMSSSSSDLPRFEILNSWNGVGFNTGTRFDILDNTTGGTATGALNFSFFGPNLSNLMTNRPLLTINNGPGIGIFNTSILKIFNNGNLVLNSNIDSGFKFDVNGTARIYDQLTLNTVALSSSDVKVLTLGGDDKVNYRDVDTIINTLYNSDGIILSNRVVDLSSFTLNFSSTTQPDTLVLSGGSVGIGKNPLYKLDVDGDINIPTTTGATYGVIRQNGNPLLHSYGTNNLFIGKNSGNFTITGSQNVGIGDNVLSNNTSGVGNLAIGYQSLMNNQIGGSNTAIGAYALLSLINTNNHVAIGNAALYSLTASTFNAGNVAIGSSALFSTTNGFGNNAIGQAALYANITGGYNTAVGYWALRFNTTGSENVAFGTTALRQNTTGNNNIGIGRETLRFNTTGNNSTAIGYQAGFNNLGSGNVYIGYQAGYFETGNNQLYIGNTSSKSLIYGNFTANTVGINAVNPTNALHVTATTDPVRFVGLQSASDTNILTIDTNGVVHTTTLQLVTGATSANTFTTAATYNDTSGVLKITRNDGVELTAGTWNYFTGVTRTNNELVFKTNIGSSYSANVTTLRYFVTGSTPSGVTLNIGDRWFDTFNGSEFVYIDDGDSSQWVQPATVVGVINSNINRFTTTGLTISSSTLTLEKNYYGVNFNGNVNLTLPDPTGFDGFNMIIKDEGGYAGTFRIRLFASVNTVDGSSYVDITTNRGSKNLIARNGNWWVI